MNEPINRNQSIIIKTLSVFCLFLILLSIPILALAQDFKSLDAKAASIEIDISEHVTEVASKFKVVFQWKGEEAFEVNTVKIKFK